MVNNKVGPIPHHLSPPQLQISLVDQVFGAPSIFESRRSPRLRQEEGLSVTKRIDPSAKERHDYNRTDPMGAPINTYSLL